MDITLNGKRALVTGAGDGIGREIAEAMAREGAMGAVWIASNPPWILLRRLAETPFQRLLISPMRMPSTLCVKRYVLPWAVSIFWLIMPASPSSTILPIWRRKIGNQFWLLI